LNDGASQRCPSYYRGLRIAIARDGSSVNVLADLAAFDERETLVATDEFLARGKRHEK
jgi:hypothetical protein